MSSESNVGTHGTVDNRWIPLESNPVVGIHLYIMIDHRRHNCYRCSTRQASHIVESIAYRYLSQWAEKAGLVTYLACFHDLYGIDDEVRQNYSHGINPLSTCCA